MLQILYLVHNLSDPAVARRVAMLRAGGAHVTLAGFARSSDLPPEVVSLSPINLGKTGDGQFVQRLAAVAQAGARLSGKLQTITVPDVIIGRNLEMLALAVRAKNFYGAGLVYESLDIHRFLLRNDIVGWFLRWVEKALAKKADLLITSSPAFVSQYFHSISGVSLPIQLVENKVLSLEPLASSAPQGKPHPGHGSVDGPWRIGWFGALRCRRSLAILSALSRKMNGRVEVILRGRPAYSELPNFDNFIKAEPFIRFLGPYRNPEDLPEIYRQVHFVWAIDFFEEGLNSKWLLPNRLYEGCFHGCLPIAVEGTETARFMKRFQLGFLLKEGTVRAVEELIAGMDAERFETARTRFAEISPSTWCHTLQDCEAIIRSLQEIPSVGVDAKRRSVAA